MPMFRARHLCPDLVIVELRMDTTRVSLEIARSSRGSPSDRAARPRRVYLDVSEQAPTLTDAGGSADDEDEIRRGCD